MLSFGLETNELKWGQGAKWQKGRWKGEERTPLNRQSREKRNSGSLPSAIHTCI